MRGGDWRLGEAVTEAYLDGVSRVPRTSHRQVEVVHTALHGVGTPFVAEAMRRAGFPPPVPVPEQAEPDPDFPTVAFPNPEETGALDLAVGLAGRVGADLVLANDPDADRCAVAVPTGSTGWRMLRGDEVGVLLADHLIRTGGTDGTFATTIVSSSLLRVLCAARGVAYAETLTGFKWIVRAAGDLVYGYEEALGYCVAPHLVRDKCGVSAALLVADLAAALRAEGRTLADRLDDLAREFGLYGTDQLAVRVTELGQIQQAMARLRAARPAALLGRAVTGVEDLLPRADVVRIHAPGCRVVVRPSGTEPKLKAYLEVVAPVHGAVAPARAVAAEQLAQLRTELATILGLPGPPPQR